MAVFKCKMCNGSLDVSEGRGICECEYCGTQQTVPRSHDEVLTNLFNRANNLRSKCEFDKAQEIYEKIVTENPTESEAYWGMILCKYGIEYVEDPATKSKIPTCHRTQLEAVRSDMDYQSALEHADDDQRRIYEAEASEIDRLQKEILAIVQNEKPFDVFICYKETDENGKRTQDSVIANDIYHLLKQEGFKVFYAAITLEDKLGQAYEPYIFAALNSAKVMLAVGTKPEYFNAVWVKNEWSRYLKIMKNDRSRLLIPCYRDMDAYDLPEEFAHLQAQDMSKLGFMQDLIRGIKKVLGSSRTSQQKGSAAIAANDNSKDPASTEALLKRAFMFLEDRDSNLANVYCEKVLDREPENARAYLGKLMAEIGICNESQLSDAGADYRNSDNYRKAIRFADKSLAEMLEAAAPESAYNYGIRLMNGSGSEENYLIADGLFRSLEGYKDSGQKAEECAQLVREFRIAAERAERKKKGKATKRALLYHILLGLPFWLAFLLFSTLGNMVDNGLEIPVIIAKNLAVVICAVIAVSVLGSRCLFHLRYAVSGWYTFVSFINIVSTILSLLLVFLSTNDVSTEDNIIGAVVLVPIGFLICIFIGNKIGEHKAYKESQAENESIL